MIRLLSESLRVFLCTLTGALLLLARAAQAEHQSFVVSADSARVQPAPEFPILEHPIQPGTVCGQRFASARQRYPDLGACLPGQGGRGTLDLSHFPWAEFDSPEALRLCVFYAVHALGSVDRTAAWFESQDFHVTRRDGRVDIVVVANDPDGEENNSVLLTTYKHLPPISAPENIIDLLWRSYWADKRRWTLFERSSGLNLAYASPIRIVDVKINGGG